MTHAALIPATLADYPLIQNMARFYVYDLSRSCGFISADWACPKDGLYESFDYKHYFESKTRYAFLIKVGKELAGFVLLHKEGSNPKVEWVMGEFFVLAKFQSKRIGENIASQLFKQFPGIWEVSVIPENTKALAFWRKTISSFTNGKYFEEIKVVDYDEDQPKRYILSFDTKSHLQVDETPLIRPATTADVAAMVTLSDQKRRVYEQAQPQFWCRAEKANEEQAKWFEWLLSKDIQILLVAEVDHQIVGFIIGELKSAPEVYDPGGLTLMIDDFCIESPELWSTVGRQLLHELQQQAKQRGAVQTLVVCGHHDEPKKQFLKKESLKIASEWYVGEIE